MNEQIPIAPIGGYEGQVNPKPWDYRCTVAIPHLDTLPQLALCLDLWRCQTVRPFLMVVDTGSPLEAHGRLWLTQAPDCEVHYIRSLGYHHPSAPVTAALDLAQSLCTTEYLLHTHSDVFPRRRDLIQYLICECHDRQPVVGWQMSPRDTSTSPSANEWKEAVSHTCTLLHMPTVHRFGLTWSMERYFACRPNERGSYAAWPDTESPFWLAMRAVGIRPILLGPEKNYDRTVNEWWDHARSYPGTKLMSHSGKLQAAIMHARAQGRMEAAEREAHERLKAWREEDARQAATEQPASSA
jgi:hypothetical protein